MIRVFGKLVRDDIPQIIEANDEVPIVRTVDGEEYARRLDDKLSEEVEEYRESGDVEELVDILEVVHAIRENRGITADQLQEMREQKAEHRGRFDDGVVLDRVET